MSIRATYFHGLYLTGACCLQDVSSRHGDDSSDDTFTDGDGGQSEEESVTVK